MNDIIISIIPQSNNSPFPYGDYMLVIDSGDKLMKIFSKMDAKKACEEAIMISQVLEFVGMDNVRFSTLAEDEICSSFISAYRKAQEKRQLLNQKATAQTNK